jgi:hypothetical protein
MASTIAPPRAASSEKGAALAAVDPRTSTETIVHTVTDCVSIPSADV